MYVAQHSTQVRPQGRQGRGPYRNPNTRSPGHALVTGGGSGIGRACVLLLAKLGADGILVADLNLKAAQEVAAEAAALSSHSGFRAEAIEVDVSVEESVAAMIAYMTDTFGRVDYCIHSAGISLVSYTSVVETSLAEFQKLLTVNANGTFLVTKAVCSAMANARGTVRGSIVHLTSVTSLISPPNMCQYNASKQASQAVTTSAALENAALGIRVNCVCPTWVRSPMLQRLKDSVPVLNDESVVVGIPMNRIGTLEEVAHSAVF
ncbi:NAD(P)-binding protein [Xylariaceae sp. FL1272]|nr:NAD(P)-binding protein [Xylariaceae sp. FL1272]